MFCVTEGREDDSERGNAHALRWQIKVADFGSGALADPTRLGALGITNLGFTETVTPDSLLTGTLAYLAPEVLAGHSPTISSDVYALGVMLYQLMVGDFRKPLSPGWEAGIDDPLLREDIAEAACGDPSRRLKSAAELVERLENLSARQSRAEQSRTCRAASAGCGEKFSGLEGAASLDCGCGYRPAGGFGSKPRSLPAGSSRARYRKPPDGNCGLRKSLYGDRPAGTQQSVPERQRPRRVCSMR